MSCYAACVDLRLLVSGHRIVDSCLHVSAESLVSLMLMLARLLSRRGLLHNLLGCWLCSLLLHLR